ncbi:MAG: hypothetical protein ACYDC6_09100 [Acidobacteriaceae bacterium]
MHDDAPNYALIDIDGNEEAWMGLLETTMEMAKLAGKVANPELIQEAMKANAEALAISRENWELQKKIAELEGRVKELRTQRDVIDKVFRLSGYVFLEGDSHPHCPACWDADRKLIHMAVSASGWPFPACPKCKNEIEKEIPSSPKRDDPESVPAW